VEAPAGLPAESPQGTEHAPAPPTLQIENRLSER
jgi:hypothetical protein